MAFGEHYALRDDLAAEEPPLVKYLPEAELRQLLAFWTRAYVLKSTTLTTENVIICISHLVKYGAPTPKTMERNVSTPRDRAGMLEDGEGGRDGRHRR